MQPYYDHGGITIYHGDCREILPSLEPVDLVLTDPPYGHGDKWKGGSWASNPMYSDAMIWDQKPIDQDWIDLISTHSLNSIIWGGNYYSMPPSRCWLIWEKTEKMSTLADFEMAWTNLDQPSKLFKTRRNQDGKRNHPTQKPKGLMIFCINQTSAKSILDPFMGSGTTLVAAKDLGRKAIGIEIEEKYCEIAVKRLAQETLFSNDDKPAKPVSLDLFKP